jgi:hypothetical protein
MGDERPSRRARNAALEAQPEIADWPSLFLDFLDGWRGRITRERGSGIAAWSQRVKG